MSPRALLLFIPLSPFASLFFLLFSPFLLFVCYFQSFLSALFLLYLLPLLKCSAPLLCSLQERRRGYCCNLLLISYLAWDKQPKKEGNNRYFVWKNITGPLGPWFNPSKKINQLQFLIGIRSQLKVPLLRCNNESAHSRSCRIWKTFCQLFINNSTKLITTII